MVSIVNGRGKTTSYTLDRLGRVTGVSYYKADWTTGLAQGFGYHADSNQTSFWDTDTGGSGRATTVSYEHLNRVSSVTAASAQRDHQLHLLPGWRGDRRRRRRQPAQGRRAIAGGKKVRGVSSCSRSDTSRGCFDDQLIEAINRLS